MSMFQYYGAAADAEGECLWPFFTFSREKALGAAKSGGYVHVVCRAMPIPGTRAGAGAARIVRQGFLGGGLLARTPGVKGRRGRMFIRQTTVDDRPRLAATCAWTAAMAESCDVGPEGAM